MRMLCGYTLYGCVQILVYGIHLIKCQVGGSKSKRRQSVHGKFPVQVMRDGGGSGYPRFIWEGVDNNCNKKVIKNENTV